MFSKRINSVPFRSVMV